MQPPPSRQFTRRSFISGLALAGLSSFAQAEGELPPLLTVHEEINRSLAVAPLRLQFAGTSAAEFAAWSAKFSAKLRELIGPHQPPAQWSPVLLAKAVLPDHTREEWLLQADGIPSLPLYILRPAAAGSERLPVILAVHGHGAFGHDSVAGIDTTPERVAEIRKANYDYGRQLVREGYLVVVPCLTPFGRRLGQQPSGDTMDPCGTAFMRLLYLGQTLLGANLRDLLWSLDYVVTRADARADRMACVGLSYGGRMTMMVTALDQRIRAAVISGALNVFQERASGRSACGAQVIPGLLEYGDTPEIGSLIAPRPCIWEIGSRDRHIVPGWAEKMIARLQKAYAACGQPEHLQFHRFAGGHEWSGTTAVPMLAAELKG